MSARIELVGLYVTADKAIRLAAYHFASAYRCVEGGPENLDQLRAIFVEELLTFFGPDENWLKQIVLKAGETWIDTFIELYGEEQ